MNCNPARRSAFTIVELLVVIAIIVVLAGLVAGVLSSAKERARRTACVNNMRQFGLVLHLYGTDGADRLPPGYSELGEGQFARGEPVIDEHLPILVPAIWTNLLQVAGGNEKLFLCPNLRFPFTRAGGSHYYGYGKLLGFNYLGGHFNTPWPTSGYADTSWISPQRLTDDPKLLLLTDLNDFTFGDRASFIPHTRRGSLLVGGDTIGAKPDIVAPNAESPAELHPSRFGGLGGNVASLDGSISWRRMRDMKVHSGSSVERERGAFAVW